jgi:hypothetical protein
MKYELGFYVPEDDILHSHRRENLKSYIILTGWTVSRAIVWVTVYVVQSSLVCLVPMAHNARPEERYSLAWLICFRDRHSAAMFLPFKITFPFSPPSPAPFPITDRYRLSHNMSQVHSVSQIGGRNLTQALVSILVKHSS